MQRYSDVLLSFLASTSSQYNELKSNEVSPISTELLADTNDSHLKSSRSGFYATCDEALAIFKLPTFPISIIQWAKKNTKEVLAMEKKIQDMLVNDDCNSVQFKPMPRDVRELMHVWARFYHLNSYEYQGEPKRYVSMVKRADGSSCLPVKLLSHVARLSSAIIVPPDSLGQPKNIAEEEIYLKKRRPVLFISAANASSYAVGLVSPVGTDNIASTLSGNKRWTSREGKKLS